LTTIRVLIVDDVEQVRRDLRTALTLAGNLEVAGEAANGSEALRLTDSLQPDVVLMDLAMPAMDGFQAARRIKSAFPGCRIVALTVHDYESARIKAVQSGVDAFLVKGAPVEKIIQSVSGQKE
jgi:DNA-binding NarL/FixJ family response regulator